MTLREIIKKLCKDKGISVNKLEEELGFAKGYVSKLDKSKPNVAKIQKIADYFNVSLDYLMTGKEPNSYFYNIKELFDNKIMMVKEDVGEYSYDKKKSDLLIEISKNVDDKEFVDRMMKYMSLLKEDKKSVDDMIDFMFEKENK